MQAPERLKKEARKKWNDTFGSFEPDSPLDTEMACQFCELYALSVELKSELKAGNFVTHVGTNGAAQPNPLHGMLIKTLNSMTNIYKLLSKKVSGGKQDTGFEDLN